MNKVRLLLIIALFTPSLSWAGYVDDWMDSAIVDGPSHYKSQKRNYYSAGGFSKRIRQTRDYLVSINPPKIKAGCGGIDAVWGGVSFANAEYLVEKFERLISNAPAVAFSLAMKTLSEQLNDVMDNIDKAINSLNSIQLDDCAMTTAVLTRPATAWNDAKDKAGKVFENMMSVGSSIGDLYTEQKETVINSSNPAAHSQASLAQEATENGAEAADILTDGSVLNKMKIKTGLSDDAVRLARGFVGDVILSISGEIPKAQPIAPCPDNKGFQSIVNGDAKKRGGSISSACEDIGDTYDDMRDAAKTAIDNIVAAMKNKDTGNVVAGSNEEKIIMNSSMPILPFLKHSIELGIDEQNSVVVAEYAAEMLAFSMLDNLFRETHAAIENYRAVVENAGDFSVQQNVLDGLGVLDRRVRRHITENFNEITARSQMFYNNMMAMVELGQKIERIVNRKLTNKLR